MAETAKLRGGNREFGEQERGELGALDQGGEVDEFVGGVEVSADGAEGVEGGDAGGTDAVAIRCAAGGFEREV